MFRPIIPSDTPGLVALTAGTGFFKPLELIALREVLEDYHDDNRALGHRSFVWEEEDRPIGYVYHAPVPMTDRTWYLYWIAVAKERQGRGLGRRLLEFVEEDVRSLAGRMLLIDTAALPHYKPTRTFYQSQGYAVVAEIADYYADGDGLIVFGKSLKLRDPV